MYIMHYTTTTPPYDDLKTGSPNPLTPHFKPKTNKSLKSLRALKSYGYYLPWLIDILHEVLLLLSLALLYFGGFACFSKQQ
jgi:hypothetical protein